MQQLPVQASAALSSDTKTAQPSIDPSDGGVNVHLNGGSVQATDPGVTTMTPITPSDTDDLAVTFRALRFNDGGTVKFDRVTATGPETGVTRDVGDGEVWGLSSDCITRIYSTGTSATGIDALT